MELCLTGFEKGRKGGSITIAAVMYPRQAQGVSPGRPGADHGDRDPGLQQLLADWTIQVSFHFFFSFHLSFLSSFLAFFPFFLFLQELTIWNPSVLPSMPLPPPLSP